MTIKDLPLPLIRGEITPVRLITWYSELLDIMDTPFDILEYIIDFDEIDIQNLLVYGSNMMPEGWPHDSEIDAAPNCDQIRRYLDKVADYLSSYICHFSGWEREQTTKVSWSYEQFVSLRKGYHPDMDMRYATFHRRGNFYVYRSGYILKKFRVKPDADGCWHITKQFTTAKEGTEFVMGEVINYGYWEVPLGKL